jgi:hypothetical protein
MSDKRQLVGHAVLSGGCPFHRGAKANSLAVRPEERRLSPRRSVALSARSVVSSANIADDNGPLVTDFTKLFPDLDGSWFPEYQLRLLCLPDGPMDVGHAGSAPQDNPTIPAGFTFLGQFLDHDMTFDVFSDINSNVRAQDVRNALTPTLDLGNVYGRGPVLDAFLYDDDNASLVYGTARNPDGDVCRNPVGTAIIGDPRNDDNLFVSQIELAFIKFHNQVVQDLSKEYEGLTLFNMASRLVRWHYQWMVYHDFLPRFIGRELFEEIERNKPQYFSSQSLAIPIEFSAAAYRMGHATVRQHYRVNAQFDQQQVFDLHHPGDFVSPDSRVDWKYLFNTDPRTQPQSCKLFDTFLASELLTLPTSAIPGYEQHKLPNGDVDPLYLSLAGRNLLRQNEFGLPAGQTVARHLGVHVYSSEELGVPKGWDRDVVPLWYYILKEAKLANQGHFLGPVGGRIVGEVFFGLLLNDPDSFLHNEGFKPSAKYGSNGTFTMADLLRVAEKFQRQVNG